MGKKQLKRINSSQSYQHMFHNKIIIHLLYTFNCIFGATWLLLIYCTVRPPEAGKYPSQCGWRMQVLGKALGLDDGINTYIRVSLAGPRPLSHTVEGCTFRRRHSILTVASTIILGCHYQGRDKHRHLWPLKGITLLSKQVTVHSGWWRSYSEDKSSAHVQPFILNWHKGM